MKDYFGEEWIKVTKSLKEYPVGTKAKSYEGGHWVKNENGWWKWAASGTSFPTVGGDWDGTICLPEES